MRICIDSVIRGKAHALFNLKRFLELEAQEMWFSSSQIEVFDAKVHDRASAKMRHLDIPFIRRIRKNYKWLNFFEIFLKYIKVTWFLLALGKKDKELYFLNGDNYFTPIFSRLFMSFPGVSKVSVLSHDIGHALHRKSAIRLWGYMLRGRKIELCTMHPTTYAKLRELYGEVSSIQLVPHPLYRDLPSVKGRNPIKRDGSRISIGLFGKHASFAHKDGTLAKLVECCQALHTKGLPCCVVLIARDHTLDSLANAFCEVEVAGSPSDSTYFSILSSFDLAVIPDNSLFCHSVSGVAADYLSVGTSILAPGRLSAVKYGSRTLLEMDKSWIYKDLENIYGVLESAVGELLLLKNGPESSSGLPSGE